MKAAQGDDLCELDAEPSEQYLLSGIPDIIAPHAGDLLDAGWSLALMPDRPTDVRRRVEADHPDGGRAVIVARPSNRPGLPPVWRGRNVRYFVQPADSQQWFRLAGAAALAAYAETRSLHPAATPFTEYDPTDAPTLRAVRQRCECAKKRFTRARASNVLLTAKIRREVDGIERRRERRAYRCTLDRNVWHLTSREQWHD